MQVNVAVDIRQALEKIRLSAKDAQRGTVRALNKTAQNAKVDAARQIKLAGYGAKIGAIKKGISIKRASLTLLVASVRAYGKSIPLSGYSARQTKAGVSVNVKNGTASIKGAFIATMPGGHKGVFIRVNSVAHQRALRLKLIKAYRGGRKNAYRHGLPIRELFGPAVPGMFENSAVQAALVQAIRLRFPMVLKHELEYIGSAARH